jgi:hypothetical protein
VRAAWTVFSCGAWNLDCGNPPTLRFRAAVAWPAYWCAALRTATPTLLHRRTTDELGSGGGHRSCVPDHGLADPRRTTSLRPCWRPGDRSVPGARRRRSDLPSRHCREPATRPRSHGGLVGGVQRSLRRGEAGALSTSDCRATPQPHVVGSVKSVGIVKSTTLRSMPHTLSTSTPQPQLLAREIRYQPASLRTAVSVKHDGGLALVRCEADRHNDGEVNGPSAAIPADGGATRRNPSRTSGPCEKMTRV